MPPLRRRLPPELFETRTDAWRSVGLSEELEPSSAKRAGGGLLLALLLIAGALVVYSRRAELAPGYETWVRVATVVVLAIAGAAAATLAVGRAFTAIVLGLAAQQTIGDVFAGIVLQSTRPFRVEALRKAPAAATEPAESSEGVR